MPTNRSGSRSVIGRERSVWTTIAALLVLLALAPAHAAEPQTAVGSVDATGPGPLLDELPDERVEAGLLTIAPGPIYWQRFGHNAIVLRDRDNPERAVAVNYGIFDFSERGFLLNFLRGRMHYYAQAGDDPAGEIDGYRRAGRGIAVQWLDLAPRQVGLLRARLARDVSPRHARYRYDYFTRNCSTRVRDALDAAFEGALERSSRVRSRGWTYRQQSLRLARPDLPLALGIHFGLAGFTDRPLTLWEEAFVPQRLADAVADLRIGDRRAVARSERLSVHTLGLPDTQPPAWRWAFATTGLVLAALLWFLHGAGSRSTAARRAFALSRVLILLGCGLAGSGLLALWLTTDHIAAHRNLNLLVASPLCLLWLIAGGNRRTAPARIAAWAVGGVLVSLAFALWFAFTEAARQDFADWLLLVAPMLLVLARLERTRAQPRGSATADD